MSIQRTRAILLRMHAFSESSRVLRFFSEDHGVVGVMARGIRRTARGGAPDLFGGVDLTFYLKPGRDLHTLKEVTTVHPRRGLGTDPLRLACAAVLAEIVLKHHGEGESREVFHALSRGLDQLADAGRPDALSVLLLEGWGLVSTLGFHPQVDVCVMCGEPLGDQDMARFDFEAGGARCPGCVQEMAGPRVGPGARDQLRILLSGTLPPDLSHLRAHLQLLSYFVTWHLSGGRPLDAFRFLAAFLPAETGTAHA